MLLRYSSTTLLILTVILATGKAFLLPWLFPLSIKITFHSHHKKLPPAPKPDYYFHPVPVYKEIVVKGSTHIGPSNLKNSYGDGHKYGSSYGDGHVKVYTDEPHIKNHHYAKGYGQGYDAPLIHHKGTPYTGDQGAHYVPDSDHYKGTPYDGSKEEVQTHYEGTEYQSVPDAHYKGNEFQNVPSAHYIGTEYQHAPKTHYKGTEYQHAPETHYKGAEYQSVPKTHYKGTEYQHAPETHYKGAEYQSVPETHYKGAEYQSVPETHYKGTEYQNIPQAHYVSPDSTDYRYTNGHHKGSPKAYNKHHFIKSVGGYKLKDYIKPALQEYDKGIQTSHVSFPGKLAPGHTYSEIQAAHKAAHSPKAYDSKEYADLGAHHYDIQDEHSADKAYLDDTLPAYKYKPTLYAARNGVISQPTEQSVTTYAGYGTTFYGDSYAKLIYKPKTLKISVTTQKH